MWTFHLFSIGFWLDFIKCSFRFFVFVKTLLVLAFDSHMCFWFFVRCRFLCNSLVLELTRARSFAFSSLEDWHKEQLFIMNSFTYIRQFILAALLWMETFDRRQERKQAKECPICNKFITANLSNYNECINFLRRFWVFQKYKVFVFLAKKIIAE